MQLKAAYSLLLLWQKGQKQKLITTNCFTVSIQTKKLSKVVGWPNKTLLFKHGKVGTHFTYFVRVSAKFVPCGPESCRSPGDFRCSTSPGTPHYIAGQRMQCSAVWYGPQQEKHQWISLFACFHWDFMQCVLLSHWAGLGWGRLWVGWCDFRWPVHPWIAHSYI